MRALVGEVCEKMLGNMTRCEDVLNLVKVTQATLLAERHPEIMELERTIHTAEERDQAVVEEDSEIKRLAAATVEWSKGSTCRYIFSFKLDYFYGENPEDPKEFTQWKNHAKLVLGAHGGSSEEQAHMLYAHMRGRASSWGVNELVSRQKAKLPPHTLDSLLEAMSRRFTPQNAHYQSYVRILETKFRGDIAEYNSALMAEFEKFGTDIFEWYRCAYLYGIPDMRLRRILLMDQFCMQAKTVDDFNAAAAYVIRNRQDLVPKNEDHPKEGEGSKRKWEDGIASGSADPCGSGAHALIGGP